MLSKLAICRLPYQYEVNSCMFNKIFNEGFHSFLLYLLTHCLPVLKPSITHCLLTRSCILEINCWSDQVVSKKAITVIKCTYCMLVYAANMTRPEDAGFSNIHLHVCSFVIAFLFILDE